MKEKEKQMINENRKHIFENLEGSKIEGGKENRKYGIRKEDKFQKERLREMKMIAEKDATIAT